jgi:hypothetical protein
MRSSARPSTRSVPGPGPTERPRMAVATSDPTPMCLPCWIWGRGMEGAQ